MGGIGGNSGQDKLSDVFVFDVEADQVENVAIKDVSNLISKSSMIIHIEYYFLIQYRNSFINCQCIPKVYIR